MSLTKLSPSEAARLKIRAYRKRQLIAGNRELTVVVPNEAIAFLDEIKAEHGYSSRAQALLLLIEQGRQATRQTA